MDAGHIKAELFLGFRDKRQFKRLQKQRKLEEESRQRRSLYQRLFSKRTSNASVAPSGGVASSSSDEDDENFRD